MTTVIEQRVKTFLEGWNLRGGEIDETASCAVCGGKITDGNFALIDGVLICLDCKNSSE